MLTNHPIDQLIADLETMGPYPQGVVSATKHLRGTGFFPVYDGLWYADKFTRPPFPYGAVMVLGHDFGTMEYVETKCTDAGEDKKCPTWTNLQKIFTWGGLNLSYCFFTNVYMGLRSGGKMTGTFPGARDEKFVARCLDFLNFQIKTQRPRLILILGINVPSLIASLSPELNAWESCKQFKDLDQNDGALRQNVTFPEAENTVATVVALTHPSLWHRCVMGRTYKTLKGKAAEIALLKDAVELSFNLGTTSETHT